MFRLWVLQETVLLPDHDSLHNVWFPVLFQVSLIEMFGLQNPTGQSSRERQQTHEAGGVRLKRRSNTHVPGRCRLSRVGF